MLKIKDDVDLKELEKFGFKPKYDEDTGEVCAYQKKCEKDVGGLLINIVETTSLIRIYKAFRGKNIEWRINKYNDYFDIDTLYDLIQARISRKGVNMRIITKKEEKEIESIKKQNEFLSKGYRAMNIALDYQRAIVSILRTLDIKEIEIDDKLLYTTEDEIRVHSTINHTTIIKLVEKE